MYSTRLEPRFNPEQLRQLLDQSLLYGCGCPMQLSELLLQLTELYETPEDCVQTYGKDPQIHGRIAQLVNRMIPEVEDCLISVLVSEGWDPDTLDLPKGLPDRFMAEANF